MSNEQFIWELIGLLVNALLIMSPFIIIYKGRAIVNWFCRLIKSIFGCYEEDEYDENGDYIKRD